jgi:hypothetical protein
VGHKTVLNILKTTEQESQQHFNYCGCNMQHCSGLEQELVCVRYVSAEPKNWEIFLGLYQPPDTKGATIAALIKDVLIQLDLPLADLRRKTYGGAANVAGEYRGC